MESQWVTFKLSDETFGFEIQYVQEMLRMPEVHAVPQAASDNLGVILLRNEVIPVFDMRCRFGMGSRQEQAAALISRLHAHQKDHEDWVAELEQCVQENREFALGTDPHECAFGKWCDTCSDEDADLSRQLQRLQEPHQKLHTEGETVKQYVRYGNRDQALTLAAEIRDKTLMMLDRLFAETIEHFEMNTRLSLIVVGTSACTIGIAVDEIHSVITCRDEEIQPPDSIPGIESFPGLIGLLPQKQSHKFAMLLDPAQIYPQLILSERALAM